MTGIKHVLRYAKNGIPDMGIPQCEPYFVKESNFVEHNVKGTLYDTRVFGLTNLQLLNLRSDLRNLTWYSTIYFPNIKFYSNYLFTTTVLVVPLIMRGKFECTMVKVKSFVKFGGKLIQESNEQYLRLDKFKMEIKSFDYFGEFDPGTKNIIIRKNEPPFPFSVDLVEV